MRVHWLIAVALVGCKEPAEGFRRRPDPGTTSTGTTLGTGLPTGVPTGTPTGTTSGTTTPTFDCSAPLPAPPFQQDSYPIRTEEDFDFSLGGYLVYQSGIAVVGTNKQAQEVVLSPGAAGDPRGVHGLSDGRIAIMSPWDGEIKISDPVNHSLVVLAGGLNTPNGVEVDSNDRIYFTTYGEVGWTEPDGSDFDVIFSWPGGAGFLSPNGTVLSEDEQQLTVAVPGGGGDTSFVTFARLGPDEWDAPVVLTTLPGFFSGVDQDVCGNLYTVEYTQGQVVRIDPLGNAVIIANLNGSGWAFSAVRFGPGHNDWDRDHLYVTSRGSEIIDLTIGVPGRRHPTTP